jgi:hypothetical protein
MARHRPAGVATGSSLPRCVPVVMEVHGSLLPDREAVWGTSGCVANESLGGDGNNRGDERGAGMGVRVAALGWVCQGHGWRHSYFAGVSSCHVEHALWYVPGPHQGSLLLPRRRNSLGCIEFD